MSAIDRREGQHYAADIIMSSVTTPKCFFDKRGPLETILDNLETTAKAKPCDFADGVLDVIKKCRGWRAL